MLAAEGQQLGRQQSRAFGCAADGIDVLQRSVRITERSVSRGQIVGEELGVAMDHEQHVVEVMGDPTGQSPD